MRLTLLAPHPGSTHLAYRYRTQALVGPWRATRAKAIADAIRAQQAEYDSGGAFRWRVAGTIEEEG